MRKLGANAHIGPIIEGPRASPGAYDKDAIPAKALT
jgi:hypothetical protein